MQLTDCFRNFPAHPPPLPPLQAVFLDTPGIITNKRNKLEDKMMVAVQQVGLRQGTGWLFRFLGLWEQARGQDDGSGAAGGAGHTLGGRAAACWLEGDQCGWMMEQVAGPIAHRRGPNLINCPCRPSRTLIACWLLWMPHMSPSRRWP